MQKRLQYKHLIFREFYYAGSLSCAELSSRIGKSIPLTTQMINNLIKEGVVEENGLAPSNGGRRPALYSVKPDAMYVVAVAMDQMITRIAIVDFHNKPVGAIVQHELLLANNPGALTQLKNAIEQAIKKSKIPKKKVLGVGIGMPGFIDAAQGINYSFFPNESSSITAFLGSALEIPVYIDNDSSIIALAEHRFGAAAGARNAMVVNLGWGVGLGLILNNQLYRGESGFAGEFSHIPFFNNNKICSCGKRGCLETETSLKVIIEKAEQGLKRKGSTSLLKKNFRTGAIEKDWQAIVKAAQSGDEYVIRLLTAAGYDIGRGVAVLIHLFNPELVLLSGRGAQAGRIWQAPVLQAVNEHCILRLAENTAVKVSQMGSRAELIGAAALVLENLVRGKSREPKKMLI
ncbi:ROK family protein [Niabella drilacis]|uniref:Sugar kinase of the NBD/HSP70 family, may contain an N-terminal HTH domain n=1 Tax=Niabella drilacis (strain DSM 25811 / CCM 8410 / CCUG 62505 / LMG 26954 / E90) TaxID=1285928 RepID=A0A1G6PV32_NIADE|nr:ROK family protein [Niabella drilacis]SDC83215.1 Sugar kinase of the NBD/HSP70 family, may contain an N-terminal HTH domain [Niabella drilacis]